ncbi:heavy metal translocating P-type ATPase [Roseicella aquatilis]|uniref:P-type Zn(2+) transporter n=1 Tax=Roseicella aquatilis TaxID=2527868 RepID=A0A4R4D3S3_9PROT|nr:heavy metal translocating P-type ATPase [Roseicella aquatilis]TCZ52284.1 cadmium-translocating P-type ATPase [Roseicella aquatilis]
MGASTRLSWRVEGMDCASCVARVTKAVERVPGVSDVEVNLVAERLTLSLDGEAGRPETVEARVASLGYTARRLGNDGATPTAADRARGHGPARRGGAAQGGPGAHGHDPDEAAEAGKPWWRTGKALRVWMLGVLVGGAYLLSLALPQDHHWPFHAATLLALIPFGRRAVALARAGSPFSIETLMCTAALGAVVIGAAEEAAVVVLLFAVGELLENVAVGRARAGIRTLAELMPRTARRLRPDGTAEEVPPDRLAVGDLVLVRPGDRVPCDGTIEEGRSALDESPVTGESVPVSRGPGEAVVAGSISADGALRVRVARAAADNTVARIIRLVEEATASRAPTQRFIERFSAWWTPGAMAVSAAVILLTPVLLGWGWQTSLYRGLAVLLIACPCALVISVPAAMASGLSAGARRGLLVKGGAALEAIGAARTVAFDKTGTLTEGRPRVTRVVAADGGAEAEVLTLAAAVEAGSAHPLAKAVVAAAAERGLAVPAASEARAEPGRAVIATVAGRRVAVGSPRHGAEVARGGLGPLAAGMERLQEEGNTVSVVLADGAAVGLLAFRDEPRPDAAAGIAALAALGARSVMLTGDNARTGAAVGRALGLEVRAGLLPDDKLREVAALRAAGPVAMVGDGINDAPALAAATVGIAMGGGTDLALEAADAAVLKDRVTGVVELVALSRATMANVRQNVTVAVGLKAVFLATTLAGVTGLWPAILADTGATVLVTLNALRLLAWRPAA